MIIREYKGGHKFRKTLLPASKRESRGFEKTMRSLVFMTPKRQEPELPFRQKGSQN